MNNFHKHIHKIEPKTDAKYSLKLKLIQKCEQYHKRIHEIGPKFDAKYSIYEIKMMQKVNSF